MNLEMLHAEWMKRALRPEEEFAARKQEFSYFNEFARAQLKNSGPITPLINLDRNIDRLEMQIKQQLAKGTKGQALHKFVNDGCNKIQQMFVKDASTFMTSLMVRTDEMKAEYYKEAEKQSNVMKSLLRNQEKSERYSVMSDQEIGLKQQQLLLGTWLGDPYETDLVVREAKLRNLEIETGRKDEGLQFSIDRFHYREPWKRTLEGQGIEEVASYFENLSMNNTVRIPVDDDERRQAVEFKISELINVNQEIPEDVAEFE